METLDRSVLVAAAAGSGKTAVLVQRIINIILEGRADVDEMLIVTFTKAAASEMKMKLSRAIKKKMKESPEDRIRLQKQLDKLYKAYISTYDSFALRVVKEFFYKLDMEPKFSAIDEADSGILKNYAVDMLFEEAFERDDLITGGSFREFLRLYSSDRSEKDVKERIIKTYDALRTMPDYFEWAHETAKDMIVDPDKFTESKLCEDLRESCRRMLHE